MSAAGQRALRMLVLAGLAGIAQAVSAQALNDTGVLQCLNPNGQLTTACTGTGYDAGNGRDVTQAAPGNGYAGFAFARICNSGEQAGQGSCPAVPALGRGRNQWGCTLDTVTGLMWEIKTGDGTPRDRNRGYTNFLPGHPLHGSSGDAAGFVSAVNAAGLCGSRDWRLPTRLELTSIVNFAGQRGGPLVDMAWFPNTVNWYYWTSTPRGSDQAEAMFLSFDKGSVLGGHRGYEYPVRLVRSTTALPAQRWVISADGTEVTDQWTNLVWRRCVEGMFWDGLTCAGTSSTAAWQSAVTEAPVNAPGWRLPNIKELSSIIDETATGTRIDPTVFPAAPADVYWSSTNSNNDADYCWSVNMATGHASIVTQNNWDNSRRTRLVRDNAPVPGRRPQ